MKSGNVVVPLNPGIEKDQFDYIKELCETDHVFIVKQVCKRFQIDIK